jgi:hypothetical protein
MPVRDNRDDLEKQFGRIGENGLISFHNNQCASLHPTNCDLKRFPDRRRMLRKSFIDGMTFPISFGSNNHMTESK